MSTGAGGITVKWYYGNKSALLTNCCLGNKISPATGENRNIW